MLDYIMAEAQRMFIDNGLAERPERPKVVIPKCDDGHPCYDGRCPMCGSDLGALVWQFCSTPEALQHDWHRGAFVLATPRQDIGDASPFDFEPVRAMLSAIIAEINVPTGSHFAFITSYGLIVKDSRKYAAVEYLTNAPRKAASTAKDAAAFSLGIATAPLTGPRGISSDETIGFVFDLLYGYNEYDEFDGLQGIDDEALLGEMALNYGPHHISQRLVTHGVKMKAGRFAIASAETKSLLVDSFDGLSE